MSVIAMFIEPGSTRQVVISLCVALVVVNIFAHNQPYHDDGSDFVAELALWSIVASLLWVLASQTNEQVLPNWLFTAGLFLFNLCVAVAALGFCGVVVYKYCTHWKDVQKAVTKKQEEKKERELQKAKRKKEKRDLSLVPEFAERGNEGSFFELQSLGLHPDVLCTGETPSPSPTPEAVEDVGPSQKEKWKKPLKAAQTMSKFKSQSKK